LADDFPVHGPRNGAGAGADAGREDASQVLPLLMLHRLPRRFINALNRGGPLAMVLTVPDESWLMPLRMALHAINPGLHFVERKQSLPSGRKDAAGRTAWAMGEGLPVVAVVTGAGQTYPALDRIADHYVIVAPDHQLLAATMRRCLSGRVPRRLYELSISSLDYDELVACLPSGGSVRQAMSRLAAVAKPRPPAPLADVPSLEDAWGYGTAKSWGLELKQDVADLRRGAIDWAEVDRGVLLTGPTGVGKTSYARMLAANCGLPIVVTSVGTLFATSAGTIDGVIKALRGAFEEARKNAPSILFLDEIDGFPSRAKISSRNRDWWLPVINEFLVVLDSAISEREGVIVLGATNAAIEDIDPALTRPGRMERCIHIGLPDAGALEGIL
jgi:hypothetical protein